jgi:hypothetical protein
MGQPKFIVFFTREEGNTQHVFLKVKARATDKMVSFGGKTFLMDWSIPLFVMKNTRCYVVNWTKGTQLSPNPISNGVGPEDLDMMFRTKVIKDIASAISDTTKDKIFSFIIGAICGALGAALIVYIVMSGKIETILQSQANQVTPIVLTLGRLLLWR